MPHEFYPLLVEILDKPRTPLIPEEDQAIVAEQQAGGVLSRRFQGKNKSLFPTWPLPVWPVLVPQNFFFLIDSVPVHAYQNCIQ